MRKIKLRVWDKENKKWLSQEEIKGLWHIDDLYNQLGFTDSYYPVSEFTGLFDKNGKEIFEGDVLNWDNECTILIKWSDGLAGFYYDMLTQKNENIVCFDIRFYRSDESAEVIGNVFENPELLEDKK